jgi:hypothetical protein
VHNRVAIFSPTASLLLAQPRVNNPPFMEYFDKNLWGIFAMPVGMVICFGPLLLAWFTAKD